MLYVYQQAYSYSEHQIAPIASDSLVTTTVKARKIIEESTKDSIMLRLVELFKEKDHEKVNGLSNEKHTIQSLNTLALYLLNKGETDSTQTIIDRAFQLNNGNYNKLKIDSYNLYAFHHFLTSDHKASIEIATKALDLGKATGYLQGVSDAHNRLGQNYWASGDLERALANFKNGLNISYQIKSDESSAILLANIGTIHFELGEYIKARQKYQEAIIFFEKINDHRNLSIAYSNLATTFYKLDDLANTEKYFRNAFQILRGSGNDLILIYGLLDLGEIMREHGHFESSEQKYEEALEAAERIKFKRGFYLIYKEYYRLYEVQGRYDKAFEYLQLFQQWKDSVSLEDQRKTIAELNLKYDAKEKENKILVLSQQNLKKAKTIKYLLLLSVIISLLVIAITYIIKHRSRLNEQKLVFNAMAQTELKERRRVARDIHDGIGTMLALLKVQLSSIGTTDLKNAKLLSRAKEMLANIIEDTRKISHDMVPEELLKFGLISAVEGLLNDLKISDGIKSDLFQNYNGTHISVQKELQIYRIIQELVQNVIKHSESKVLIITILQKNGNISLNVEDKGKGFSLIKAHSKLSYGLKSIESRVNFLKGSLVIDSKENLGTSVKLNIPCYD